MNTLSTCFPQDLWIIAKITLTFTLKYARILVLLLSSRRLPTHTKGEGTFYCSPSRRCLNVSCLASLSLMCSLYSFERNIQFLIFSDPCVKKNTLARRNGTCGMTGRARPIKPMIRKEKPRIRQMILCVFLISACCSFC